MADEIKREEISKIFKQLNDCTAKLKQGNIHTCLLSFKAVMEKILTTQMLPSDEKELMEKVNSFQRTLSESKSFKDIYGPVSFHAKDIASSLDFVKQLIRVEEDKIRDTVDFRQKDDSAVQDIAVDMEKEAHTIMQLIDEGNHSHAKELIADNDILVTYIVQAYNRNGIRLRKEGAFESAIVEYEKALVILPDDEGLHYNMARVLVDKKDWEHAKAAIQEALKINPLFNEGNDLLKYIDVKSSIAHQV